MACINRLNEGDLFNDVLSQSRFRYARYPRPDCQLAGGTLPAKTATASMVQGLNHPLLARPMQEAEVLMPSESRVTNCQNGLL